MLKKDPVYDFTCSMVDQCASSLSIVGLVWLSSPGVLEALCDHLLAVRPEPEDPNRKLHAKVTLIPNPKLAI